MTEQTMIHGLDLNGWPDPDRPGYPEDPEKDGNHLLQCDDDAPEIWPWNVATQEWGTPETGQPVVSNPAWRYIGPVKTPAEIRRMVNTIADLVSDPGEAALIRQLYG